MSLFGNRELQALRQELERATAAAAKAERESGRLSDRLAAVEGKLAEADCVRRELETALKEAGKENGRLTECRVRADRAAAYYEEKFEALSREIASRDMAVENALAAGQAAREAEAKLQAENSILKLENERLSARLERASVVSVPVTGGAVQDSDEIRLVRAEMESLKRRLAESDEMRQVALRKAEHNRRAWLVTQMQLDLAEDRLCLLTTGKPRPVMESRPVVDLAEGEAIEAEDVEDEGGISEASEVQEA